MTLNANIRLSDIQFLRVQGDGLDPAALMMIDFVRWGMDNSPALLVGLCLGAVLSWIGARVGVSSI